MLYCPGKNVTSHKLATVYHDYCKWYATLPSALRLGQNFTPAVLFAQYVTSPIFFVYAKLAQYALPLCDLAVVPTLHQAGIS